MSMARRARGYVLYRGLDISRDITSFDYTDNYDGTDDLSIRLTDKHDLWLDRLFPETGEILTAGIQVFDWLKPGDNRFISLGEFEIDGFGSSGEVSIDAVAVPITSSARSEKKNRAWKQIALSGIAGDIAGTVGLALVYETGVDPFYDVADQNDKTDLEFLEELCKSDGLCMKITKRQLIVFEESRYETLPVVAAIIKGKSNIFGEPDFRRNAKDVYKACEVSHFDPKTDRTYTGYFAAPNASAVGHTLKIREQFNSELDDVNLERKAKARLREKNKNEWACGLTVQGDIIYFAGVNIEIEGWKRFDGKYHIASCRHSISPSGGYTVSLNTRRCLEGY